MEPTNVPPTFQDEKGRQWTIKLTLDLIDSVYEATQIDLVPDDNDVSAITSILFSHRKLGSLLWECCKRQAESQGVDRAEFFSSLDGDSLANGWGAVVDAIVFFIQKRSPTLASAIRDAIEAEMRVAEMGTESMRKALASESTKRAFEGVGRNLQKEMEAEIAKAAGSFAMKSPE